MRNGKPFFAHTAGPIINILLFSTNLVYGLQSEKEVSFKDEGSGTFWDDIIGQEYVAKLNSFNLEKFNEEHAETFVMFYANWCKSSVQAKGEFALAAQELAYTEGYDHVQFGALDCNATLENKRVCNRKFSIVKYPRFLFFENGRKSRMYTIKCPRHTEFFYNWIVDKGDEKYCSGSLSLARATSSSGLLRSFNPALFSSLTVLLCVTILLLNQSSKFK